MTVPTTAAGAAALRASFDAPPPENVPSAYWFWHRRPTADEVREQVRRIAAGGFGTFLIQARLAYPISEYLDEGFLAAYRLAVEEAAALGLEVGIYDDYNWASGHAGGLTVAGHDEVRERQTFWSTVEVSGGRATCTVSRVHAIGGAYDVDEDSPIAPADVAENPIQHWWYEGGREEWTDWVVVAALAHPAGGASSLDDVAEVTAGARLVETGTRGCTIAVDAPEGLAVTVFVSARCATSRLVNYLMPEAVDRFIEVGYEPFHRTLAPFFGDPIKYMFVDHPQPGQHGWAEHRGAVGHALQFHERLRTRFEECFRTPFGHALLALSADVGPATRRLRAQYFETYSELTIDTFFGGIRRWADQRGIGIAGHEMLSHIGGWSLGGAYYGRADTRTIFADDFFRIDEYRTHTTVDAVNFEPQITTRVGDSVARSHGRAGCIVEQYALRAIPGVHGAAGRWEMTLEEMRAAGLRHQLFGAKQYLFHGFYQTDGDDSATAFTNARFDFAPGINYEPWYDAFHPAYAAESARLSAFMFTAHAACDVAVLFPRVTRWVEDGAWQPYRDHTGFWNRHLSERGFTYHLVDERDLASAAVEDGRLVLGDRRYGAVVLPAVSAVGEACTLDLLTRFAQSGGALLASGPLPSALDESQVEAAAALRHALASPACRAWPDCPSPVDADEALPVRGAPHALAVPLGEAKLWQWSGSDEDGDRLAVFNDGTEPVVVELTTPWAPAAIERWNCATGEVFREPSVDRLVLEPMELRCLRLLRRPSAAEPAAPRRIARSSSELAGPWTLELEGVEAAPTGLDGWEREGHDAYSGLGVYRTRFDANPDAGGAGWEIRVPTLHTAAQAVLNGVDLGRRGWLPYAFRVPDGVLRERGNELELRVWSSAGTRYYHGTPYAGGPLPASGLTSTPLLVATREEQGC